MEERRPQRALDGLLKIGSSWQIATPMLVLAFRHSTYSCNSLLLFLYTACTSRMGTSIGGGTGASWFGAALMPGCCSSTTAFTTSSA